MLKVCEVCEVRCDFRNEGEHARNPRTQMLYLFFSIITYQAVGRVARLPVLRPNGLLDR